MNRKSLISLLLSLHAFASLPQSAPMLPEVQTDEVSERKASSIEQKDETSNWQDRQSEEDRSFQSNRVYDENEEDLYLDDLENEEE